MSTSNAAVSSTSTHPTIKKSASPLARLSRIQLALLLLVYILLVHITGLYYFTRGFLLTRLSLEDVSPPYDDTLAAPFPPTHSKAIILIIDALRTDFVVPHTSDGVPASIFHHNIFTLPAELTAADPSRSLIFHAYADPPTTTMQRLKAITTGSLPTFIDAGANFASTAILEDSIIQQLKRAGKKLAFMGDDTWVNLFPDAWSENMSHPFDSFNVEDLHSVDEGVIRHLMPYMAPENSTKWDVMIGHFLGVDHVGHRVGPSAVAMSEKLKQMDTVLRDVVDRLDDDTLLVLLGDHGMDDRGDHGGDDVKETSSALWIYSKGAPLVSTSPSAKDFIGSLPVHLMLDINESIRTVNQIDLVPSLSLLLGTPIPFNNLASVIPELFLPSDAVDGQMYRKLGIAMKENALQIRRYHATYSGSTMDQELEEIWNDAEAETPVEEYLPETASAFKPVEKSASGVASGLAARLFGSGKVDTPVDTPAEPIVDESATHLASYQAYRKYSDTSLAKLRALWAQFSIPDMAVGLLILGLSVLTLWAMYVGIMSTRAAWPIFAIQILEIGAVVGAVGGSFIGTARGAYTRQPSEALTWTWSAAIIFSELAIIVPLVPTLARLTYTSLVKRPSLVVLAGPGLMVLHSLSFAANSFIMWEDRMVMFFFISLAFVPVIKALTAPVPRMRFRIMGFSFFMIVLVRLLATSTVCREEQQPFCSVTFYAGQSLPVPPKLILYAALPTAWYLPQAIYLVLGFSKSNLGPAPIFIQGFRFAIVMASFYWIIHHNETLGTFNPDRIPLVKIVKVWLARIMVGVTLGAGTFLWATMPLCIEVRKEVQLDETGAEVASKSATGGQAPRQQVTVLGFANSYGSSYLLFLLITFAFLFLVNQPTGQVIIAGVLIVLLTFLETMDAQRDARAMTSAFSASAPEDFDGTTLPTQQPLFSETAALALLGHIGFFATGHQVVLTTIQWSAAFILSSTVVYPVSPMLVAFNAWGSFVFLALTVPLIALWNVSPKPNGAVPILADALQACIGFLLYFSSSAFASAVCAAWLRRHLMVWKVFAPRFMMAAGVLLLVDVTMILAIGVGLATVASKVRRTFNTSSL